MAAEQRIDSGLRAAWLDGTAHQAELDQLAADLQASPMAAWQLHQEQRLHHALRIVLTPGNTQALGRRLRHSVMDELQPASRSPLVWRWGVSAAAVAAMLTAALWWWTPRQPTAVPHVSGPALAAGLLDDADQVWASGAALPAERSLRVRESARLEWGAGNTAEIIPQSQFRWRQGSPPRLALDHGSAQVAIAQGPFALHLPDLQIAVQGTAFAGHRGWWGSSATVSHGQVTVAAAERRATLGAGEARWLLSPAAQQVQQERLQAVDSTWSPTALQSVLGTEALAFSDAWQGAVVVAKNAGQTQMRGNGRFLPTIPGEPSYVRVRLALDHLDGRAGLVFRGDSHRLSGEALHQDTVGAAWELDVRARKIISWPGLSTWLVEGQVNGQPLRVQVDSHIFSAGLLLEGEATLQSFTVETSNAWPVWQAPHPNR